MPGRTLELDAARRNWIDQQLRDRESVQPKRIEPLEDRIVESCPRQARKRGIARIGEPRNLHIAHALEVTQHLRRQAVGNLAARINPPGRQKGFPQRGIAWSDA